MNAKEEARIVAVWGSVAIWGTLGVIFLLNIVKELATEEGVVEPRVIAIVGASVITVVGVLSGDKVRRATGVLWYLVAGLGFLAFVVGAGLEMEWLFEESLSMLFVGIISGSLIFLPDP